jgi:hypothetical protein
VKERPILFSAPMVRAILEGRKTQTRRVMKPQPEVTAPDRWGETWSWPSHACRSMVSLRDAPCLSPYGYKRDRLWVKETHQIIQMRSERIVVYRASCPDDSFTYCDPREGTIEQIQVHKWRPSIFMPRLESRITLEVTGVRVERLHDISGRDVLAEGVDNGKSNPAQGVRWENMQRMAFESLWSEINGAESWDANPWVWVISFQRVEAQERAA